jgi:hypothetical protein
MIRLRTMPVMGGDTIPRHLTTLSVSWLSNQFRAVAVHRCTPLRLPAAAPFSFALLAAPQPRRRQVRVSTQGRRPACRHLTLSPLNHQLSTLNHFVSRRKLFTVTHRGVRGPIIMVPGKFQSARKGFT